MKRGGQRTFVVLLKHFFSQFFVNESIPLGAEGYKTTIHLLAILTAPGLFIPLLWLLPIYSLLQDVSPETRLQMVRYHQFFFITLSMAISAIVALLQWDRLFLMPRDRAILLALPVPGPTLHVSKLAALIAFVGTFTFTVNFFSVLLFPSVVFVRGGVFGDVGLFFLGHMSGVLGGALFVFFLVVVLQGLILVIWRSRPRRLLGIVQLGFLVALTLSLSLYGRIFASWELVSESLSFGQILFPPFWYLGLAQSISGASEAVFVTLSKFACWGLLLVFGGGMLLEITFQRRLRDLEPTVPSVGRFSRGNWALSSPFRLLLADSAQMSAVFFVVKTLLRSARHRMILTSFLGVGVGLSITASWSSLTSSTTAGSSQSLLAIPQILTFVLIVGMRVAFAEPAEPEANWVFRLNCSSRASSYLAGVRKLVILVAVFPLLVLAPMFIYSWGWIAGLLQFGFSLVLALVLKEVVLFGFYRIPFTATYLPGRANLKLWWAFYLFCFSTYAYTTSVLGHWLLSEPMRAVLFEAAGSFLLLLWFRFRRSRADMHASLAFESENVDRLLTLSLK